MALTPPQIISLTSQEKLGSAPQSQQACIAAIPSSLILALVSFILSIMASRDR